MQLMKVGLVVVAGLLSLAPASGAQGTPAAGSHNPAGMGSVGGPKGTREVVLGRHMDVYSVVFRGGELAQVAALGDGDSDLDLYIYDENGNLVASDTDLTDQCYARWTPKWTGVFRIEVRNLGWRANAYSLLTN